MTTDGTQQQQDDNAAPTGEQHRLDRLIRPGNTKAYNPLYSKFIRWAKLVMPLVALAIAAVVFTWSSMNDTDLIVSAENAPKTTGKNELLNPRFESMDDKQQPFTVTAQRASQSADNEDLVILENPQADMKLNSGQTIGIRATRGAYKQEERRLLLQGAVHISHDDGYHMEMSQLNVDVRNNRAWAHVDIAGEGPAGTINAKGLEADSAQNTLIFTGPARLTITLEGTNNNTIGGFFAP